VIITDYPDKELIENIKYNVENNLLNLYSSGHIAIQGYIWGTSPNPLLSHLPSTPADAITPTFDLIILSDLLFNHSQHHAMLRTCRAVLTPRTGAVYVFYTHHRPHLAERDMRFFEIAARPENNEEGEEKGYGFRVERVLERRTGVMFAEDPGDEDVRATVHGWKLWLEGSWLATALHARKPDVTLGMDFRIMAPFFNVSYVFTKHTKSVTPTTFNFPSFLPFPSPPPPPPPPPPPSYLPPPLSVPSF
ncbi:hypothetical protein BC937DRAFT_87460, partial [Endogone sp. FLAS-F59071]